MARSLDITNYEIEESNIYKVSSRVKNVSLYITPNTSQINVTPFMNDLLNN